MTKSSTYLIGAGGHAEVLRETLIELGTSVDGFVTLDGHATAVTGNSAVVAEDVAHTKLDSAVVALVNTIGSTADLSTRARATEHFANLGFEFRTVVSTSALVADSAHIGIGAQILRGAIVNTRAHIGDNAIVNSGAIIEHHVTIGAGAHVSPGAVVCGGATVGARTHIGAGATIIQGVSVGDDCVVGAGAVVLADVPDGHTSIGVPARSAATKERP